MPGIGRFAEAGAEIGARLSPPPWVTWPLIVAVVLIRLACGDGGERVTSRSFTRAATPDRNRTVAELRPAPAPLPRLPVARR